MVQIQRINSGPTTFERCCHANYFSFITFSYKFYNHKRASPQVWLPTNNARILLVVTCAFTPDPGSTALNPGRASFLSHKNFRTELQVLGTISKAWEHCSRPWKEHHPCRPRTLFCSRGSRHSGGGVPPIGFLDS